MKVFVAFAVLAVAVGIAAAFRPSDTPTNGCCAPSQVRAGGAAVREILLDFRVCFLRVPRCTGAGRFLCCIVP